MTELHDILIMVSITKTKKRKRKKSERKKAENSTNYNLLILKSLLNVFLGGNEEFFQFRLGWHGSHLCRATARIDLH